MLVVSFSILKKIRLRGNPKEPNERQKCYERLVHIDMNDSKKAAYAITKEASFFTRDNEAMQSAYKILFEQLESYKYVAKAAPIDEDGLALYEAYCHMIVV
jgi:hypothetical protein